MSRAKIAVTLERTIVGRLDRLVRQRAFPSRSRAVEEAVREKLERLDRGRLARECAKLNPASEQAMAEEAIAEDLKAWPEY